jgi:hypothetical protein
MRHGKDTIIQATNLIDQMRRHEVKAFNDQVFGLSDRSEIQDLVRLAKRYHSIQEHDCNGTKTVRMATLETNLKNE